MTSYQAEKILRDNVSELEEPLRSAIKFALNHWNKITGATGIFIYPSNWLKLGNLPNEEWRDVQDYEGLYQVSSFGRVKSLHKYVPRILKPSYTHTGYLRVNLSKNGKGQNIMVHVLVAAAFLKKTEESAVVNHKNNDHTDNRLVNLEWLTRSENTKHAYQIGAIKKRRGADVSLAKFTEQQVRDIRANYIPQHKDFGAGALARKYSVAQSTILRIIHRESYKNVI